MNQDWIILWCFNWYYLDFLNWIFAPKLIPRKLKVYKKVLLWFYLINENLETIYGSFWIFARFLKTVFKLRENSNSQNLNWYFQLNFYFIFLNFWLKFLEWKDSNVYFAELSLAHHSGVLGKKSARATSSQEWEPQHC